MSARILKGEKPAVERIYDAIARDSASSARRVENTIRRAVGMLAMEPALGVDLGYRQTRRWPMTDYKYTIFYRVDWAEEYIEVIRVVESSRVRNLKRVPR